METHLRSRIEHLVNAGVTNAVPVGGGFTTARCWSLTLDDDRRVFVKVAADDESATAIRTEALALQAARGDPFPELIGVSADGTIVAIEDLSHADWSCRQFDVDFWAAVERIGSVEAPDDLHHAHQGSGREWWSSAAADDRFPTAIGLDPEWSSTALPTLIDASKRADHVTGWRFVDWASAHRGNVLVDHAIASVRITRVLGVPSWSPPLDDHPEFVAFVGGRFASELLDVDWSGAPPAARADRLRDIRASCDLASTLFGLPAPATPQDA